MCRCSRKRSFRAWFRNFCKNLFIRRGGLWRFVSVLLYAGLTEIGYECVKPDGAFYLFVKTPGGDNRAFCERAKAKNLRVVPSEPFGVEGYFRLGYCVSKEMIERALPVFREVFEEM